MVCLPDCGHFLLDFSEGQEKCHGSMCLVLFPHWSNDNGGGAGGVCVHFALLAPVCLLGLTCPMKCILLQKFD